MSETVLSTPTQSPTASGTTSLLVGGLSAALVAWLVQLDFEWVRGLAAEDAILEWTQFLCFLLAAVIYAKAARLRRSWVLFLLAAASFLVAGEEISWGQRVFGFSTPDSLEQVNAQDEFNFHNIEGVLKPMRMILVALAGLAFVVVPYFGTRIKIIETLADKLRVAVPSAKTAGVALFAVVYLAAPRLILVPREAYADEIYALDEIGESAIALVVLIAAIAQLSTRPKNT